MPRATTPRDAARRSNGRVLATVVGLVAAGMGATAAGRLLRRRAGRGGEGHAAPDLPASGEARGGAGDRAPEAFRPDPTATPSAAEREALRPATGPSPTLVEDRGATRSLT